MKKPPRQAVRAKQQDIAHLQSLASLKEYLPRWRITGVRPDGVIQTEREKDPWESDFTVTTKNDGTPIVRWKEGKKPTTAIELVEWDDLRRKRMVAKTYGAAPLYAAQAALNEEYRVAVAESLAGIETDDLRPLKQHLALIGPTLLAAPQLLGYFHDWWCGSLSGDSASKTNLTQMLEALKVGSGRYLDQWGKQEIKDVLSLYREEHATCRKAKEILRRKYYNPNTHKRTLMQRVKMSPKEIEKDGKLSPSSWAVKRVADRLDLPKERVRKIVLAFSSRKTDS